MSSIEDRLNELAKKVEALTARLDKFEQNDVWGNTTLPFVIDTLCRDMEEVERDRYRWDEVYYKVFPERLDKDLKFRDQLHRLKCPPKSEDDKTKR